MRNLKLLSRRQTTLPPDTTCFVVDEQEQLVYHASSTCQLACSAVDDGTGIQEAHIVSLALAYELEAVCAVLSTGHILTINIQGQDRVVHEVGCVADGVVAAAWSPGGDMLALVTAARRVVALSLAWDVIADTALPDASASTPTADLTWRGDGKYLAVAYNQCDAGRQGIAIFETDAFTMTAQATDVDCATGCLAWQPNGRNLYVAQAVGGTAAGQAGQAASIPDWVRALESATGPDASGIHPASYPESNSARPASHGASAPPPPTSRGNHTAARAAVGIYETNGLPHGGFWVGVDGAEATRVAAMAWSPDSSLLAVVVAPAQSKTELGFDSDVSTLGTTCLVDGHALNITPLHECVIPPPMAAARLVFPAPVCLAAWAPSAEGTPGEAVAVALATGGVCVVRCSDSWATLVDNGVLHGAEPAPEAIGCWQVPVPQQCLTLPSTLHHHAMCCPDPRSLLLAVYATHTTHVHNHQLQPGWWLLDLLLDTAAPVVQTATMSVALPLPDPPRHLVVGGQPTAWLVMQDGGLLAYTRSASATCALQPAPSLPRGCDVVRATATAVAALAGSDLVVDQHVVARDCTSFLLVEGRPEAVPLLLWTSRAHRLHVQPLAHLALGGSAPVAGGSMHGVPAQPLHGLQGGVGDTKTAMLGAMRPAQGGGVTLLERSIERGSMLLAAPRGANSLVLHLPRGNLETVQPRALVLPAIAAALAALEYRTAWRLATVNRVDVNLLVDYSWPSVLQHMPRLVDALDTPAALCDLLQGLQPGSVLHAATGLYRQLAGLLAPSLQDGAVAGGAQGSGGQHVNLPQDTHSDKIPMLCSAVRAALTARPDADQWFSAVLTSHVVQADLGEALRCVATQRRVELQNTTNALQNTTNALQNTTNATPAHAQRVDHQPSPQQAAPSSAAEAGVRHLLTCVDAETLYRAALGVYELEVAYLVVACSSKDPAEYLLQLQAFRDAGPSPHRIAHAVDVYLERWQSAMEHLLAADDLDAALALASAHGLLRSLLAALPPDSSRRGDVLQAYAASLERQHRLEDAALAYVAAGDLDGAQRAYRGAGCWQQVLSLACADAGGCHTPTVARLAADIAAELAAMHRPLEAAQVLLEYCDDVEGGVVQLCEGQAWRAAVRQSQRVGRGDLVETVVVPAAAARVAAVLGAAGDALARVDKYLERWRGVVDKRKAMQAWQDAHAQEAEAVLDDDAVSLVSTMVSGLSAYSAATHATTAMSSSVAPSTVGGRPAQGRKKKNKEKKIKQGSGAEEAQLHALLIDMGPSAALLQECRHEADARLLQGRVAAWVERFEAVKPEVEATPPMQPLPGATKAKGVAWKFDLLRK